MSAHKNKKNNKNQDNSNISTSTIREVYLDNFEEEMKIVSSLIDQYNFVAFDTEFPGIVFINQYQQLNRDSFYQNIKANVDRLKVIQVGITLADSDGNNPPGVSTWQFNFDFNLKNDLSSPESINLLINSGINFDVLSARGISPEKFAEYFITSGLMLNDKIHWITFHGSYDFSYVLKVISGQPLPDTYESFKNDLALYFQNYYDIKYLLKNFDEYRGSLNKLAYDFSVARAGSQHQAGSDSKVTSMIFFKLIEGVLNREDIVRGRNKLFCMSETEDFSNFNEVSQAQPYYNNNINNNGYNMNTMNNINFPTYDPNFMYNQLNPMNYQYNLMRMNNMGTNNNYQQKVSPVKEFNSNSSTDKDSSSVNSNKRKPKKKTSTTLVS
jgi:CCR4-NOT transcription complex subunit 7/8